MPEDATSKSLTADREVMLQQILGRVGKNCYVEPPFFIDYGCNISIGSDFYANFKCVKPSLVFSAARFGLTRCHSTVILDCGLVTIGDRVMFGPYVSLFAATHETEVQSRRQGVEFARPVTIGNDCWIGGQTTILPGVTIGNGCTIGAGSVVTKDIPPFSVAIGSPARVIKKVTPVPDI